MKTPSQRIAIIGSGISGLTAGYILSKEHHVSLFEANQYLGGHTHTEHLSFGTKTYSVNTGFIVFNDWTYPNFIKLMNQLGVQHEASDMSFSVQCQRSGLEYNGTSLNSLYAQRKNLISPSFNRMVWDILRFNRQTTNLFVHNQIDEHVTLGDFLKDQNYSKRFCEHYILPMGASIWSATKANMLRTPLLFFVRFFHHHGMLSVNERPTWQVLTGGSSQYIQPITEAYQSNIYLNTPVRQVTRTDTGVIINTDLGNQAFDQVVFACHSDQALALLDKPSVEEQGILSSIPYQKNDAVLHTDTRLMPSNNRAWASWNAYLPDDDDTPINLTYDMNRLQNLDREEGTFLVTLNRSDAIDPDKIIRRYTYHHPIFTAKGMHNQQRHSLINNQNRTHYCGAYWFNGFHEDGVNSALRVCQEGFGLTL